jgi:hypothetical protein
VKDGFSRTNLGFQSFGNYYSRCDSGVHGQLTFFFSMAGSFALKKVHGFHEWGPEVEMHGFSFHCIEKSISKKST